MFHFANLFYMRLVSGECRLALVLYRLYLGLAKTMRWCRCQIPSDKTQVTKHLNPHWRLRGWPDGSGWM
jgi:hypothetical protein